MLRTIYYSPYTLKVLKMCDGILITVLKIKPHCTQSSRENGTPFHGTSLLAYC